MLPRQSVPRKITLFPRRYKSGKCSHYSSQATSLPAGRVLVAKCQSYKSATVILALYVHAIKRDLGMTAAFCEIGYFYLLFEQY